MTKRVNKKLEEVKSMSDEELLEREKELYLWSGRRVVLGIGIFILGVVWFVLSK